MGIGSLSAELGSLVGSFNTEISLSTEDSFNRLETFQGLFSGARLHDSGPKPGGNGSGNMTFGLISGCGAAVDRTRSKRKFNIVFTVLLECILVHQESEWSREYG